MSYFVTPAEMKAATAPASRFLTGTGSPEGVTAAPIGTTYTDTAATAGAVEWTKWSGTGTTGWRVTKGDTGWQDLALVNGWSFVGLSPRIRRMENRVTLEVRYRLNGAAATTDTFATIPSAFVPTSLSTQATPLGLLRSDAGPTGTATAMVLLHPDLSLSMGKRNVVNDGSLSWVTDKPWSA